MAMFESAWFKSSYSGTEVNCVEVAHVSGRIAVRDSKHPTQSALLFDRAAWSAFVAHLKSAPRS